MILPLAPPVLAEGDGFQLVVALVFLGIWILSWIATAVRRASEKARRRFQEMQGPQRPTPPPPERQRRAAQPQPQPSRPERAPAGRELLSDLESILRDQLGLPIEGKREKAPPPSPVQQAPAPARPPQPARPSQPARPPQHARPAAAPRRQAAPAPQPVVAAATPVRLAAAIGSAYDLKVTEEMKRRGEPKGIHSAHRERTNQAYAIQARRRGISHKVLRTMLSGGGLRRAVVLTEILGRPRAEQEFAAPGSTSGTN